MQTSSSRPTIDPGQWLPAILLYLIPGDLMAVRRDKVTWSDLVHAREGHRKGQERARQRCWRKAYAKHSTKLALLEAAMETFAPLMQANPTLGFEDACARMTSQALKVRKEL
jgi:hypothetical protein